MELYTCNRCNGQNHVTSKTQKIQKEEITNPFPDSNRKTANKAIDLWRIKSVNEEDDRFCTDVFEPIQAVSNYLYFILLSPCKVVPIKTESGNISIEFVSSPLRKVVWVFYQILAVYSSLQVGILSNKSSKTLQEDPVRLYYLFTMLAFVSRIIMWPIILLSKRDDIKSIFYNCYQVSSNPTSSKTKSTCINVSYTFAKSF